LEWLNFALDSFTSKEILMILSRRRMKDLNMKFSHTYSKTTIKNHQPKHIVCFDDFIKKMNEMI